MAQLDSRFRGNDATLSALFGVFAKPRRATHLITDGSLPLKHNLPQHIGQDAAVAEVFHLDGGVHTHGHGHVAPNAISAVNHQRRGHFG